MLSFLKPLVLAHISDLSMLTPLFAGVLVNKAKMSQDAANIVAGDLVNVVEKELTALINRI